ncbi:hypothetical protein P7C70_g9397, partial [Phenoliferia sp. Uapishka_3]
MSRAKLPQLLSHLPHDGLNSRVFQSRWIAKGLPTPSTSPSSLSSACYWDVKSVKRTEEGMKAFGVLYWKGKRVTPETKEFEPIKGGLKYTWETAVMPPLLDPAKLIPKKAGEQVA